MEGPENKLWKVKSTAQEKGLFRKSRVVLPLY